MNILKKLRGDANLDPKERSMKVSEEMNVILKKYNCKMIIDHTITIIPLEESSKSEGTQE